MNVATDFPGLEITEIQHPCPPVGLFVCLRGGQSAAADRCVCSRFKRGSHGEVSYRFLCIVPLERRQGCPRLTCSHLTVFGMGHLDQYDNIVKLIINSK